MRFHPGFPPAYRTLGAVPLSVSADWAELDRLMGEAERKAAIQAALRAKSAAAMGSAGR